MDNNKEAITKIIEYIKSCKYKLPKEYTFDLRKERNKHREFPAYSQVEKYISETRNYESFFERIVQSCEEYIEFANDSTIFTDKYVFDGINKILDGSINIINKMLKAIKIKEKLDKIVLETVYVDGCLGIENNSIKEESIKLANLIIALSDKATTYLRSYAFFGESYRIIPGNLPSIKGEKRLLDYILKTEQDIQKIIDTDYVFDFFSDGANEFRQIIPPLFKGLYALCLIKKKEFGVHNSLSGGVEIPDVRKHVDEMIEKGYSRLDELLTLDYFKEFKKEEIEEMATSLSKIGMPYLMNAVSVDQTLGNGEKALHSLIGLKSVKESIKKIKAYVAANKKNKDLNVHMCFYGNPGTGKTEVARIIAQILYENKILPTNNCIEVDRGGLVGEYVGETPQKTMYAIRRAMGGVLFVDEAYALAKKDTGFDFGHEAIATLLKAMEDYRGKFCVILAGYKNQMDEMLSTNPGFKSRIQFHLDFENYTREELSQIMDLILIKREYEINDDARDKILDITDVKRKDVAFANARELRNIMDQVIMCTNLRNAKTKKITIEDVDKYIKDSKVSLPLGSKKKRILTPEEELDELVGLTDIKKTIKKIRAFAKKNKDNNLNLHMCFYGNPGTGKTEVARIVSRLLYDAGVLREAKVIETNPNGLIGEYIGSTGPKTENIVKDALGGVLFIDEAYGLSPAQGANNHGSEAIATLLKEMEDKRGQFCCVLAGYRKEMKAMLATNPGFESRIQFELDFPDYSREELKEIGLKVIRKKEMTIDDDALEKVLDAVELERNKPTFANARTLRNILDKVILNQNLRTEDEEDDKRIIYDDVLDYFKENNLIEEQQTDSNSVNIDLLSLVKEYSLIKPDDVDADYIEQSVISISSDSGEQGTGFIISSKGLCLTCNHCLIEDGSTQKARISFIAGKRKIKIYSKFVVLAKDEKNDLGLIKLLDEDNEYCYFSLADWNYEYKPLKPFITAGYPFGGEVYSSISMTDGKIASVNNIDNRKTVFANMFGKPGSSGSPILDERTKEVIGVFWGGISHDKEMIPCFTPIEFVWKLLGRK